MVVILVVSSDGRIGRHVRSVLGSQGWWVTTAADREEALRAAADQEPALVVVDCETESAAELVRVFGSKNGGPGVLLLEPPGDEGAFHAFEAGADQILSKPPKAQALLEAADRVMSLPHRSSGGTAAGGGEKLSAAEIFGDVLLELEATDGGSAPVKGPGSSSTQAPSSSGAPSEPVPAVDVGSRAPALRDEEQSESPPGSEVNAAQSSVGAVPEDPPAPAPAQVPARASKPEPEPGETPELQAEQAPKPELDTPSGATSAAPETIERKGRPETAVEPMPEPKPEDKPAPEPEQMSEPAPEPEAERVATGVTEQTPYRFDPATLGAEAEAEASGVDSAEDAPEPVEPPAEAGDDGEQPATSAITAPPTADVVTEDKGRFGQYRLEQRIAVGGMAEVWRASMLGMEGFRKTVAIKKILPHLAENEEFVTMFIEEAKLAAQLSHENLVEIYDLGKIGESFFIAMEYVDGKDLRGVLNRLRQKGEQMPIGMALLIGAEVARGLEYAHARADEEGRPLDLVHRDVSPRNVLIGQDGRVRLCDFGVAKAVSSVVQTQIGALKGKLQYMSPEQAAGRAVDNRSDIYSLGSVMYEMISGRRLYEEDNEISLLDAARAGNFDDPRKHCPGLPEEVRRILIKALAKKPSTRYQRAGALERDLRELLSSLDAVPGAGSLAVFLGRLFAPRTGETDGAKVESGSFSIAERTGPNAFTRSFTDARFIKSRVARFWWGVIAGLIAAGIGAALLRMVLT